MSLSRTFTAQKLWQEAISDVRGLDQNDEMYIQRFEIMNRVIEFIIATVYDLVSKSYVESATASSSTTNEKRLVSGQTATWTVSTKTLSATSTNITDGTNTGFASGDVGKTVMFLVGSDPILIYNGYIQSYTSTGAVVLGGVNLPTSDSGAGGVLVALFANSPLSISSEAINLSSLKMMRTGQQIGLEIESTATTNVKPMSTISLNSFSTSDVRNRNSIAWAFSGDKILLKKGTSLSSYGTLTVRYPRIPTRVTGDTQYIDVPEGTITELVILKLKSIICGRLGIQNNYVAEMVTLIKQLYGTFEREAQAEEAKSKILALK